MDVWVKIRVNIYVTYFLTTREPEMFQKAPLSYSDGLGLKVSQCLVCPLTTHGSYTTESLISQQGLCNITALCPNNFYSVINETKNALAIKCPQHCTTRGPTAALTCQVGAAGRCFSLRTDLVLALKVGKGVPHCCSCCPLAEMLKQTAFSSAESCLSQHRCRYKQTEDGWCFQSPSVDPSFPVWFPDCIGQALPIPSYH